MTWKMLEKGKLFFDDYIKKFPKAEDPYVYDNVQLKKEHSLRVAKLSAYIANKLKLDEQQCQLAEFIGLMHDIGRFSQFAKYQSFDDLKTEDHAVIGVNLLKEEAFFGEIGEADQQIIVQAIESHNKAVISSREKPVVLFSQILRDADKLDIWDTSVTYLKRDGSFGLSSISLGLPKKPGVSEIVIRSVLAGKPVLKKDLQSINDFKLFLMSMVFDLNFKVSFQWLNQKQSMSKIYDTLPKRDDVISAYRQIKLFIENKFVGN